MPFDHRSPAGALLARAARYAVSSVLLGLVPAAAHAQIEIRILDDRGEPIAFANVSVRGGTFLVADDSGRLELRLDSRDSIQLHIRRIGFREFRGWARLDSLSKVHVVLAPLARTLDRAIIAAPINTPLAQAGFCERVKRVQRGAAVGEFQTPEDLAHRDPNSASRALTGMQYVRVLRSATGKPVLTGRGGCMMSLIVDGQPVFGMVEELMPEQTPTSLDRRGTRQVNERRTERELLDVDQVVDGRAIIAIEVYPSLANAPAELQRLSARGSCGIVAIWTGPRT